jgi:hypothetical protein
MNSIRGRFLSGRNSLGLHGILIALALLALAGSSWATDRYVPGSYATIQLAIDASVDGDVIYVAAGSYAELVNVNKRVAVIGAGMTSTTITRTVSLTAADGTERMMLKDLSVVMPSSSADCNAIVLSAAGGNTAPVTLENVTATGSNSNGCISEAGLQIGPNGNLIDDIQIVGCHFDHSGTYGLYILPGAGQVTNLNAASSSFDDNDYKPTGQRGYGVYIQKNIGGVTVSGVTFTNCSFNDNLYKGMYIEALSNALFDNITVNNSGTDANGKAGVDLNLKYGDYSNISFVNPIITNSGTGATTGAGLFIKGRNDGSYAPSPASLTGVTITGGTITGCPIAVSIGNNVTGASVGPHGTIIGTIAHLVNWTDAAAINAEQNYWGSVDGTVISPKIGGNVDWSPWCNADFSICTLSFPVHNITRSLDYSTIQAAVTAANAGDVIQVDAGSYTENVNITQRVSIIGAGSGSDPATSTIITQTPAGSGDSRIGVIQLTASGISAANPILLQDIRLLPNGMAGISVGRFTEATGQTVDYVKLDNVQVIGTNTNPSTEQERGIYVDLSSSLRYLDVVDCAFNNLTYGWYIQKVVSTDASNVQYVSVGNTTFNHNNHKGFYAEKLSDATFTGCTFDGNGYNSAALPDYFRAWSCGFDVNLKAGTYANITVDGCFVTNNAIDQSKEGAGLTIKARDDGATYGAYPAALNNVDVINCTISGNERGLRFGEPTKNNATPTNVTVYHNTFCNNVRHYSGSDGTAYGALINMTTAAVNAEQNYWCSVDQPAVAAVIANGSTGSVDYTPWCNSDFSNCLYGLRVHNLTQLTHHETIQAAVTAANPGDVITADAGVYYEHNITLNKSLTLTGDIGDAQPGPGANAPIVDGQNLYTDAFLITNGTSNVTIQGFEIRNYAYLSSNGEGNAVQAWVASTNHIIVADNYMHNLGWNGVLVGNDDATGDHSYWTIARNILSNYGTGTFSWQGYGFELTNTSHGLIEDNIITAGTLQPACGVLVTVRRPSEVDMVIRRNSISGDYDYYGMAIYAYNVEVPSPNLNGLVIENNSIEVSGPCTYALSVRDIGGTVTNTTVRDNKLIKVGGSGLRCSTAQTINASGNWWGSNVEATVAAAINGAADFTPYLDNGMDTAPGTLGFQGDFHTLNVTMLGAQTGSIGRIQEAANMVSGSTINLMAGTYVGQVMINAFPSALDIVGMGATPADVVIKAAPSMTPIPATTRRPVVAIVNSSVVNLFNLTVDGDNQGSTNNSFIGVAYWNAGGSMTNCNVQRVEDATFSGAQHGVGVYGNNNDVGAFTITLNNVLVDDFQKTAMAFSGVGLSIDLDNCSTIGAGDTPVTAQNGIQIGYGATGTVDHCTISGMSYIGSGWTASGILLYASGNVAIGNSTALNGCQSAVYALNSSGSFINSSITGNANSDLGVLGYNYTSGLLAHRGREIQPLAESNTGYLNNRSLDANASFNVSGSTIVGGLKTNSIGVEGYAAGDILSINVANSTIRDWDIGLGMVADGGTFTSAAFTGNVLGNTTNAYDNVAGHTWDANCYSDFAVNSGYPTQYNIDDAGNVDLHPNVNSCTNVDLTIVDPYIGCPAGCNNTDVVNIGIDQAGLTNLELVIQLPAGFALNCANGTDIRPPAGVRDPHVTAAWVNAVGTTVNIAFTWEPPYSSGVSTQLIAAIPVINTGATTGTYGFAGLSSNWADDQGNMHPNTFFLGTVSVNVDCDVPVITSFTNSATCAFGAADQMVNKFTAVLDRGTAPGDALLESAWIMIGANRYDLTALNPAVNPNTVTFPATAGDAAILYGWLANNACTTITLHVKDVKCNESTADVIVGRDEADPNLTVTPVYPASVGCVNDNPASPQYGPTVLDNLLHISSDLGMNDCRDGSGTLTIAYGANVFGTTFTLPLSDYPDLTQAGALWTWMKLVLTGADGATYTFDVTSSDCAGNTVTLQFNICVDVTDPENTVDYFDARPADAGVWLAWQWAANSQAVAMEIWRSPLSGEYPQYPGDLWNSLSNYSDAVYPPVGWTKVTTQTGSGIVTSAAQAAINNNRGDVYSHVDGSWTYWLDAEAGWSNANAASTFRDIYRYITFVKDAGGNWSVNKPVIGHWDHLTAGNADRSTNYWLGDFTPADAGGMSGSAGFVDTEDLDVLAASYFKQVGAGAAAYCNIGPVLTENGNVGKGIPNPDVNGFVNFYDLVPFSFNYNMVSPVGGAKEFLIMPDPNTTRAFAALDETPSVSICRTTDQPIVVGEPFTITVSLSGNESGAVKAVEAILSYNADLLEFVSASTPAVELNQGSLFSKASLVEGRTGEIGMVAAGLGNGAMIVNNAVLSTVTFRWIAERAGNADLSLVAVRLADGNGGTLDGTGNILSIGAEGLIPQEYSLHQNFPNPFNPQTEIAFDLKAGGYVTLNVFNVLGQRVATLVNTTMEAGKHRVTFDAANLSSGLYVYQIQVNGFTAHRKMLLMR